MDNARCGCPRWDTGYGIAKKHDAKCAERAKPKPKKAKKK